MSKIPGKGVGMTLWGGGPQTSTMNFIDRLFEVQPQIAIIHAPPEQLIDRTRDPDKRYWAERATALARAAVPDIEVWWQVGGDALDQVDMWPDVMAAAVDADASAFCLNCEVRWKKKTAADAEKAMRALDDLRDCTRLGFSTFGWPVHVSGFGGGHEELPLAQFCGEGGADFMLPQIYVGKLDKAPPGWVPVRKEGLRAYEASVQSHEQGEARGLFRKGMEYVVYLSTYSVHRADAITTALQYPAAVFWASVRYEKEPHGRQAFHALAKLYRLGLWKPDGVEEFQRSNGLVDDGIVGTKTLGAMGIR